MTHVWRCRDRILKMGSNTLVMGIINVTPDSFSDGGRYDSTAKAVEHALRLVAEGADILDVGGESSRPGAEQVSQEEELRRVVPVIEELGRHISIPISVDTVKAEVARRAVAAGACIINDISGFRGDADLAEVVRSTGAGYVLMHMQGSPQTMYANPVYTDVVAEIGEFFEERLRFAEERGIDRSALALDPGIGFGKNTEHSLKLIRHLADYQRFLRPVCLGVSRKGFIGRVLDRPTVERTIGSVAITCYAMRNRSAQIVRVHDVAAHRDAVKMMAALITA